MGAFGITGEEYAAWLAQDARRILLAQADAYSGVVVEQRYLATAPFVTRPIDTPPNTTYVDVITETPSFEARLSEVFLGRSLPAWGDIVLYNPNGDRDAWLDDGWDGRAITLSLGAPGWNLPDYRPVLTGVIADIDAPSRDTLAIKLRDKTHLFDVPIQTSLIGGTSPHKDQPIPLAFGECFNVEPVLISSATHTYQVHDGPIEAITAVRDNGVGVSYTPDLAAGTFTLTASPAGRITADVKGAKPAGSYLTKCADIVQHIALTRTRMTAADIDAANIAAMNALCAQTLGRYIKDRTNAIDVIDDLITSVGGFWTFTRGGLLSLGRLDAPAGTPVLELIADDIEAESMSMVRRDLPRASVRLGYAPNFAAQDADALAGAVTEANRALYAAPYQVAKAVNAVSSKHLLAANPDVVKTCLAAPADALTEATRRAALSATVRTTIRLTTFARAFALSLGAVVRVTHPRFGFAAGALAVVVGIRERVMDGRIELDLWK